MEKTEEIDYDIRRLAEFCDHHPKFGAVADDIIASQYGIRDGNMVSPTKHYFFYNKLLGMVRGNMADGSVMIDIGCGSGVLVDALAGKFRKYVGVDVSIERVRQALRKPGSKNSFFVVADAARLPFKDSCFDTAVSLEVIEHLPDTELFIKEVKRVLMKSDGLFIFSTPTSLSYENCLWQLYRDPHLHEFSYRKLKELLEKNGFCVNSLTGIGFKLPKITIPVWLGSDIIKYIYAKMKNRELKAGYGHPISAQFNIMTLPLLDKIYFNRHGKRLWSWITGFFGFIGEHAPAVSSNMVIICKK